MTMLGALIFYAESSSAWKLENQCTHNMVITLHFAAEHNSQNMAFKAFIDTTVSNSLTTFNRMYATHN